jgi:hypothetical protein
MAEECIKVIPTETGEVQVYLDRAKGVESIREYTKSGLLIREVRSNGVAFEQSHDENGQRIFYVDNFGNSTINKNGYSMFQREESDGSVRTLAFTDKTGQKIPVKKDDLRLTLMKVKLARIGKRLYDSTMFHDLTKSPEKYWEFTKDLRGVS